MSGLPPPGAAPRRARFLASRASRAVRQRTMRHGWLELGGVPGDATVKPADYLPVYEEVLSGLRNRRFSMLEIGVWKADSLAMWRDAFPRATIVGLDLAPPAVDLGPRVHIVTGDQADAELLHRIAGQYAPGGFELIIDDASHAWAAHCPLATGPLRTAPASRRFLRDRRLGDRLRAHVVARTLLIPRQPLGSPSSTTSSRWRGKTVRAPHSGCPAMTTGWWDWSSA